MYNDFPAKNAHVSVIELEKIERGKGREQLEMNSHVPYWVGILQHSLKAGLLQKICKNPVVLTIWYNAFAEIASGVFLITYTPIYLRYVHGYSVEATGLLSSLPPLLNMPFRMCLGLVSDKIKLVR
jgi:sugar phosphate permease